MLLLAPTCAWCREKPYTRLLSSISYVAVVGRAVVVAFLVFLIVKEGWQTLQSRCASAIATSTAPIPIWMWPATPTM